MFLIFKHILNYIYFFFFQSNTYKISASIESDEHLLATLEMEASKQLQNDEELLAEALLLQETLGVDLEHVSF